MALTLAEAAKLSNDMPVVTCMMRMRITTAGLRMSWTGILPTP